MKISLSIILTALLFTHVSGQVSFSNVTTKLKTVKKDSSTQLFCSSSTTSLRFQLKRNLTITPQKDFVTIDTQTVQIMLLKFSGYPKNKVGFSLTDQKQLLESYSEYELGYFKNELQVEIVNPSTQWVLTKFKGWLVWYFRVGNIPTQYNKPTTIQLFASTVVGDKVVTINAPIQTDGDFEKAGLIINEIMEALTITRR